MNFLAIFLVLTFFLLIPSYVYALDPGIPVGCCWAMRDNKTLGEHCGDLYVAPLTPEKCEVILEEWERMESEWLKSVSKSISPNPLGSLIGVAILVSIGLGVGLGIFFAARRILRKKS